MKAVAQPAFNAVEAGGCVRPPGSSRDRHTPTFDRDRRTSPEGWATVSDGRVNSSRDRIREAAEPPARGTPGAALFKRANRESTLNGSLRTSSDWAATQHAHPPTSRRRCRAGEVARGARAPGPDPVPVERRSYVRLWMRANSTSLMARPSMRAATRLPDPLTGKREIDRPPSSHRVGIVSPGLVPQPNGSIDNMPAEDPRQREHAKDRPRDVVPSHPAGVGDCDDKLVIRTRRVYH